MNGDIFTGNIVLAIANFALSCLILLVGLLFTKHPPKKINFAYGYRTERSMKNQETWDFAHQFIGKLWLKWGICTTIVSILSAVGCYLFDFVSKWCLLINIAVLSFVVLVMLLSIPPTEIALKENFDEKGNRISTDLSDTESEKD